MLREHVAGHALAKPYRLDVGVRAALVEADRRVRRASARTTIRSTHLERSRRCWMSAWLRPTRTKRFTNCADRSICHRKAVTVGVRSGHVHPPLLISGLPYPSPLPPPRLAHCSISLGRSEDFGTSLTWSRRDRSRSAQGYGRGRFTHPSKLRI